MTFTVEHRNELGRPFARITFEVIGFAILALLIGFSITIFIPMVTLTESIWETIGWLFYQLIIDAILIYVIDKAYILVFGHDSDEYIGIVIFTNILFACQVQLYQRIRKIYFISVGRDLPM
jgi:hypothetical protein